MAVCGLRVVTFALAGALFASCGGDEAGPGSASGGISKADYVERGDAICKAVEDGTQAFPLPPRRAPASAHQKFMSDVLTVVQDAREDFESLPAPDGDDAAKERFDGYWGRVTSYIERARDEAAAGDVADDENLMEELGSDESPGEAFRDYGFEVCGDT